MARWFVAGWLFCLVIAAGLAPAAIPVTGPATVGPAPPGDIVAARGEQLYRVAGCVGCHSPPIAGAVHLGGGRDNPTVFGTFWAPNISPHPTAGIGTWTEADFFRAMREGRSPTGRRYWPTFPTMAYTRMVDEDIHALWVYLRTQPQVVTPKRAHEVRPLYGLPGLLPIWRALAFRAGPYVSAPDRSEAWNRGAYLVTAVAYCDQCHTPRNRMGLLRRQHYMAGGANPAKSEIHPNLTPHRRAGIGAWTEEDIVRFLSSGQKPDGTTARADWVMHEKVQDSYRFFSESDKRAIATYLRSLGPDDFDPWGERW